MRSVVRLPGEAVVVEDGEGVGVGDARVHGVGLNHEHLSWLTCLQSLLQQMVVKERDKKKDLFRL